MQTKNTLFVVGAGASREFDLPIGKELVTKIADKLHLNRGGGDDYIRDVLVSVEPRAISARISAAEAVANGVIHASSIDRFLHIHRSSEHMVLAGKLAIARCIAEAEANCTLHLSRGERAPNFQAATSGQNPLRAIDSWLGRLLLMQQEGTDATSPREVFRGLSFITFNYDRCIQHYLFHAVQRLYGWDDRIAANIVGEIPIIHAYGTIGALGWYGADRSETIEFGDTSTLVGQSLYAAADRILTFTQTQAAEREAHIKSMMESADQIVFLGCGFNEQNLELLSCRSVTAARRVFATTYGMSAADQAVVKYDLVACLSGKEQKSGRNFSHASLVLSSNTAGKFLSDFGRALSSDRAFGLPANQLFGTDN